MTFPDFQPNPTANNGHCAVHVTGARCEDPAEWHLDLGQGADGARQLSFACNPHMELLQTEHVYAARHPCTPDCGRTSWELCAAASPWQPPEGDGRRSLAATAEHAAIVMRELTERLAFDVHPDLQGPDEEPTT